MNVTDRRTDGRILHELHPSRRWEILNENPVYFTHNRYFATNLLRCSTTEVDSLRWNCQQYLIIGLGCYGVNVSLYAVQQSSDVVVGYIVFTHDVVLPRTADV